MGHELRDSSRSRIRDRTQYLLAGLLSDTDVCSGLDPAANLLSDVGLDPLDLQYCLAILHDELEVPPDDECFHGLDSIEKICAHFAERTSRWCPE